MKYGNAFEGSVDAFGQFGKEVEARLEAGRVAREQAGAERRRLAHEHQEQREDMPPEAQAAK